MIFGDKILKYKDEIIKDLQTLLSIKSISESMPQECDKALDFILKRAEEFGLEAERVTEQSGHITLGNEGRLCGVLAHLDVVPEGNGWSTEPFALTRKNGRLYGRGIADDKGAALINLYCMRALKENDVEGKNTLRAIYGISEEVGMEDMDGYFEKMPVPEMAFTPDNDYGICYAEKGILQLEVSSKTNDSRLISQFASGKAVNAVPDSACVIIDTNSYDEQNLIQLANSSNGSFEFKNTIDGLMIISRGKAAHACEAEKGCNAASALVDIIADAFDKKELGSLCSFIDYAVNKETNGRSLGLKMSDCVSGALSVNLSSLNIDDEYAKAKFDIRYPVTINGKSVLSQFEKVAQKSNLNIRIINHIQPLYVDKQSKLISILSEAYKTVVGKNPEIYSTGGGTYARKLNNKGVAFGPNFKNDDVRMHNADESVDEHNFFLHAQICLEAMYRLFTCE